MLHVMCCQGSANYRIPLHLLEWPNSKHCQHQVLARVWSNRSCHSLLVGMQKDSATLEDRFGGHPGEGGEGG